jgi:hypothetical protein
MPQVFACSWRQVGDVGAVVERAGRGIVVVGRIDETAYPFASNSRLAPRASQSVWPSQYTRRGRWAIVDAIEVTRTSSGEWWLGSVQGSASEVGSTGVSAAAVADKPRQARTETAATTDRHPSMCLGDTRRPPLPNRAALLRSSCLARLKAFSLLDPAASTSVQLSGRDTVVPVDEALWPVDRGTLERRASWSSCVRLHAAEAHPFQHGRWCLAGELHLAGEGKRASSPATQSRAGRRRGRD